MKINYLDHANSFFLFLRDGGGGYNVIKLVIESSADVICFSNVLLSANLYADELNAVFCVPHYLVVSTVLSLVFLFV